MKSINVSHIVSDGYEECNVLDPRVVLHYGIPSTASRLAYDPIQHLLAIGTLDGRIKVIGGDNIEGLLISPKKLPFKNLEFIQSQGFLVSVSNEDDIQVWDLEHRCIVSSLQWESNVTAFSVIQGTNFMYLGDEYGTVSVLKYDCVGTKLLQLSYSIHADSASEASGIPLLDQHSVVGVLPQPYSHGNRVLLAYDNGTIILWDISLDKMVLTRGCKDLQSKSKTIYVSENDPICKARDEEPDSDQVDKEISSLCWASMDGSTLAVGYIDGDIILWNLSNSAQNKDRKPENSANNVFKLQLSSADRKFPVIVLQWSAKLSNDNVQEERLYVYGGDKIGSAEVLTILNLDWSQGREALKNVSRVDLTLSGSFADVMLLQNFNASERTLSTSIFILTSPGQLQFYEDLCLSNLFSQQEKSSSSPLPYSSCIPTSEPCLTAGRLFMLHTDAEHSKALTEMVEAARWKRMNSANDEVSKWPLSGGVPCHFPESGDMHTDRLYIAGYQDGSVQIWDATYPVLSWLFVMDPEVLAVDLEEEENESDNQALAIPSNLAINEAPINVDDDAKLSLTKFLGKRKRYSKVWENFDRFNDEEGKEQALCKYCKKAKYRSEARYGTSNALRHLQACEEYKKMTPPDTLTSKSSEIPFDLKVYHEMLAEVILKHGYSFSYVEHSGVRKLHKYLNHLVKPVSRNTIKKFCLEKHADLKSKLKHTIGAISSKVCLTCDIWTACTSRGYLTLTAHYVDNDWKLNCKVLSFCHCPPPHTGLEIYNLLFLLIKEWGIEKKVFTMTVDNASNMDNMVSHLKPTLLQSLVCDGKYFHIRCSAHILNLIVREGLKNIEGCVIKIRDNVKYIDASEGRINQFYDCAVKLNLSISGKLWLDVATRWNSTYLMLRRALDYRRVLDFFGNVEANYKLKILPNEWSKVEKICELLEPFYEITCLFSGSEYPTANLYFINVWRIQLRLEKAVVCDDNDISRMGQQMMQKFEKYWSHYNTILAFAIILDPRYKFDFLKFALVKLHGNEKGTRLANDVYVEFVELYKHYEYHCPNAPNSFDQGASINRELNRGNDEMEDFDDSTSVGGRGKSYKSEFERYIEIQRVDRKIPLDVLQFWKINSKSYPIISSMAKDILAIPITTVASESTFSMGGRILNKWRSSLLSKNVDALVTTRNWLYGYDEIEEEEEGATVEPSKFNSNNDEMD